MSTPIALRLPPKRGVYERLAHAILDDLINNGPRGNITLDPKEARIDRVGRDGTWLNGELICETLANPLPFKH